MMKKEQYFCLFLCLLLLCTACSTQVSYKTVTCGDLTINVPLHYYDYFNNGTYGDVDFAYGYGEISIVGYHYPTSELNGWKPSLTEFADNFVKVNHMDTQVEELDGLTSIYYEVTDEITWSWRGAFYQCSDGFWYIECCCPADTYRDTELTLLTALSSVVVK